MPNCPDIIIVEPATEQIILIEQPLDEVIFIESVGLPGIGVDKTFVWTQTISLSTWTVPHNLNKKVSVTVLDASGNAVLPDFSYIDLNIIQIQHGIAMTGSVICN